MTLHGPCLQLDVGNSAVKWRLTDNSKVIARGVYHPGDESSQTEMLRCTAALNAIWVSSVASQETEQALASMLVGRWGVDPWFARSQARTADLINSYGDPARMGVDRWLAMLGARALSQSRLCVIDAGSALTIDVVADSGDHEGGYIVPGAMLMERALLLDTDRVRFDESPEYALSPGTSTAQAVRHGIALAQVGAVREALALAEVLPGNCFYCGGGGQTLMELAGGVGWCVPDLIFDGLELMAGMATGGSKS